MKKSFKNQSGFGFIGVIIVIIIAVIAGGATFLGVRMAVTGEEFFAPFEELFNSDDKEDDDTKTSEKDKNDDKEDDEDTEKEDNNDNKTESDIDKFEKENLSSVAKKSGVKLYSTGDTSLEDILGSTYTYTFKSIDGGEEFVNDSVLRVDIFADKDKILEVVMAGRLSEDSLRKMYKSNEEEFKDEGYDTYSKFEKYLLDTFDSSIGADEENYHRDGYVFALHMKEDEIDMAGFAEQLDVEEDEVTVEDVIKLFEEQFDVEMKEVK